MGRCVMCCVGLLLTACSAAETAVVAEPQAPAADRGKRIISWVAQPDAPAFFGQVVVDPKAGTVYLQAPASNVAGAPPETRVEAVEVATAQPRWTSEVPGPPLMVVQGWLLAQGTAEAGASNLVLLSLDTGKTQARCTGSSVPALVGGGLGYANSGRVVRHEDAVYVASTHRSWYAGGAAPTPTEEAASRQENKTLVRVTVGDGRCSVERAKEALPEAEVGPGVRELWQRRHGRAVTYRMTGGGAPPVELGGGERAWSQPARNGGHVVVWFGANGKHRSAFWDVRQRKRVATVDLPIAPSRFVLVGSSVVIVSGSIWALDLGSGESRWVRTVANLDYHGPYPP